MMLYKMNRGLFSFVRRLVVRKCLCTQTLPLLESFPPEKIRNISIVAHVDHGKSTLADRILEIVGAIPSDKNNKQVLDKLKVERERGITVKAQTASFVYFRNEENYLINLIDTPGHVDFCSEVARSLLSCQGVVLLVDANQGVQAQTISNFFSAFSSGLEIIPVLNKVDLPNVKPEEVKNQMLELFEIDPDEVLHASAKQGTGVTDILDAVIDKVPAPKVGTSSDRLKFFIQDSWHDKYTGVVSLVQVLSGSIRQGQVITSKSYDNSAKTFTVRTLGILTPFEKLVSEIFPGQIGYLTCNMRNLKDAVVGDTFYDPSQGPSSEILPLVGLVEIKPMVFSGFYPEDQIEFTKLQSAIDKICLNDASVTVEKEGCFSLGQGFRLGFLGLLHMEVFSQRLKDEYGTKVVSTSPSVPYKIKLTNDTELLSITNPSEWPENRAIEEYYEPYVKGTITAPSDYLSSIYNLVSDYRGVELKTSYLNQTKIRMEISIPLSEILTDFFKDIKVMTSGHGTFDYNDDGYKPSKIEKIDILINGTPVYELSTICHYSRSYKVAREIVSKLKECMSREQYMVSIQAAIGGRIIARETLKAYKKDVTAKCYGGDMRRQRKLLARQAEGKKKLRATSHASVSKDVLIKVLKK